MKMPIAWHEECLRNQMEIIRRERKEWDAMMDRLISERDALQKQIDRAKREGKTAFDSERYGVKRG